MYHLTSIICANLVFILNLFSYIYSPQAPDTAQSIAYNASHDKTHAFVSIMCRQTDKRRQTLHSHYNAGLIV